MKSQNWKKNLKEYLLLFFIAVLLVETSMSLFFNNSTQEIQVTFQNYSPSKVINSGDFISFWNTTLLSEDSSNASQIHIPLEKSGYYDFVIDWGDESSDHITIWNQSTVTHTYRLPGKYMLIISGVLNGWCFNNGGDRLKLLGITQWGSFKFSNSTSAFKGCENLQLNATDAPDLSGTTSLASTFEKCYHLGHNGSMDTWDVSHIKNMSKLFSSSNNKKGNFNQNISTWNVSAVVDMSEMFCHQQYFNHELADWNTSNVVNMHRMFSGANIFNQNIESWDVSHVLDMGFMLSGTRMFNKPIGFWDVCSVQDMSGMFWGSSSFNQFIGGWNVSSVVYMQNMFDSAYDFNQEILYWNVSNVITMREMFVKATNFNQALNFWNVSSVKSMDSMFLLASSFNQPLYSWDVSSVTNMDQMFQNATDFNQDISTWDISSVQTMDKFLVGTSFSTYNYDLLLQAWSDLSVQKGVRFDVGMTQYSKHAQEARSILEDEYEWIITDGGLFLPDEKNSLSIPSYYFLSAIVSFTLFGLVWFTKFKKDI